MIWDYSLLMDHSSSPWSGFPCLATHGVLCPAAGNSCSSAMFPHACGNPFCTQPSTWIHPDYCSPGQGKGQTLVSPVPAVCGAVPEPSVQHFCSSATAPALLRRQILVMGVGMWHPYKCCPLCEDQPQVEGQRDWQSNYTHFVAIRKRVLGRRNFQVSYILHCYNTFLSTCSSPFIISAPVLPARLFKYHTVNLCWAESLLSTIHISWGDSAVLTRGGI